MPSVVRDRGAIEVFPVRPRGYRDAIRQALTDEDARLVATSWSDAPSTSAGGWGRGSGTRFGNRLIDSRAVTMAAPRSGMKRGRRDPEDLRAGDVLDCWRPWRNGRASRTGSRTSRRRGRLHCLLALVRRTPRSCCRSSTSYWAGTFLERA